MLRNDNSNGELTIFMPSFGKGGAERAALRLIQGLVAKNIKVNLVLATTYGDLRKELPGTVNIIDLNYKRTIYSIFALIRYLRKKKPDKVLSHIQRANRILLFAKLLARVKTKIYIVEHTTISQAIQSYSFVEKIIVKIAHRFLYNRAEKIIHVSKEAALDLEQHLHCEKNKIEVIYNPIVPDNLLLKNNGIAPPHPWFNEKIPVILSVGRLYYAKGYDVLINAFKIVQNTLDARLLILGNGNLRSQYQNQINNLELQNKVQLAGFVSNVSDYMKYASLFVLSSRWEALPTVLIEALACGLPVISTNCKSGPSEILGYGKYGILVPVDDDESLARGIIETLNNPTDKHLLISRAKDFSIEKSVEKYIEVLNI